MVTVVIGGPTAERAKVAQQVYELLVNQRLVVRRFDVDRGAERGQLTNVDVVMLERSEDSQP